MEEFEVVKMARNVEFVIEKIYIGQQDELEQSQVNELMTACDEADTVVSYIMANSCDIACKLLGEDGALYKRLGEISKRYKFPQMVINKILIGQRALLRANYILYGEKEEDKNVTFTSKIHFTTKKGEKTDFIRIINGMYELGFFSGENGTKIPKKYIFEEFGKLVNIDLTDYQNLLSKANKGSNNDGNSQKYAIFDRLKEASIKKENK